MKIKLIASVLILQIFGSQLVLGQMDRGVANKAAGEKRLALIIGNGAYQKTSVLPNPTNDATDMAATLSSLGFEVISGTDQNKRQMEMMIREFGDKLARQGGVGLFFYAGHGLQVKGNNYLVPVDAEIPAEDEVEYSTVNLSFLLNKMDSAKNELNIVILDACRNNPFARSWRNFRDLGEGGGLAKITPPTGTVMLYATQPGNIASDGTGRNGLFTESLLEQIKRPNLELDAMIKQLARDVSERSGKKQMPWKEGIVTGDFYFAGGGSAGGVAPTISSQPIVSGVNAEDVMWQEVSRVKSKLAIDGYLSEYPSGKYASTARLMLRAIDAENEKNAKEVEQRQWDEALKLNTIEAFQNYLAKYPNALQKDAANKRIAEITESVEGSIPRKGRFVASPFGMEFAGIPAGSFMMGSPPTEKERNKKNEVQHKVTLTKGFWMSRHEVTQAQWREVMGSMPEECGNQFNRAGKGDDLPVVCVSWEEVQEFIRLLNEKRKGKYRLPTEAEWEYAARGETATTYFWGDDDEQTREYAWVRKFAGVFYLRPVGGKLPNSFGLFDTSGNAMEFVNDYGAEFQSLPTIDPQGPSWGESRIAKGGGYMSYPKEVRSATRFFVNPASKWPTVGFRLVWER